MTKIEKYEALKNKGVELKHINNHSSDEIDALYEQYLGDDGNIPPESSDNGINPQDPESDKGDNPPGDQDKKTPAKKVLTFATSGWCEELKISYRKGVYHPKSDKEYKALKKYAVREK